METWQETECISATLQPALLHFASLHLSVEIPTQNCLCVCDVKNKKHFVI